ncbi:MAG: hypothetical protein EOP83_06050 [Verrucomicrobiaceae bacterium]|nr:MAG: hypothetical protein EOP83_06050 [Verrucomicrobiaceae bacterium]
MSSFTCEEVAGPAYEHDCEKCVYLGTTEQHKVPTDHYWCGDSALGMPTLIRRYGSEGSDYSTVPISMARKMISQGQDMFQYTYNRAFDQGLCK